MRAKFIYEKFTEESDPIRDLGIGVEKFYRDYEIEKTFDSIKERELNKFKKLLESQKVYLITVDNEDDISKIDKLIQHYTGYKGEYKDPYRKGNFKINYCLYKTLEGRIARIEENEGNFYIGDLGIAVKFKKPVKK
jgi:hypothetical protein